jgi:hypothetical protein
MYRSNPLDKLRWRFWSKVRFTETCWEWTGAVKRPGRWRPGGGQPLPHGKFWLWGRVELAHRAVLILETGSCPELVGHECDNPRCVRPSHLKDSNASVNLQEAWDRGRRACPGVPF